MDEQTSTSNRGRFLDLFITGRKRLTMQVTYNSVQNMGPKRWRLFTFAEIFFNYLKTVIFFLFDTFWVKTIE